MTGPLATTPCTLPLVEVCITEFDLACLSATGAVFDRLLALHPAQVVVDLSGCRHIDAAAIGLLLDVHRRLARADGVLSVRNPNPRIRRILHTARLDQILPVVESASSSPPGTPTGPEPASTPPALVAHGRASVRAPH
ncbi:STAS domain-containing protein [Micromonospora sp. WMMD961]|uniref:STAS domain-containing protein n=1 Tax=Micromonospora sp. WMMD961 TaxID=3016100 RepID=UPI0024179754|nr:STAS domain-containing protein [Micromonospora sp. WMMD961]MDG4782259.1 STAS domain-containing protein [Micromonospora sp. WMMD961]